MHFDKRKIVARDASKHTHTRTQTPVKPRPDSNQKAFCGSSNTTLAVNNWLEKAILYDYEVCHYDASTKPIRIYVYEI